MNNSDKKKIWILEDDVGCQFIYEKTLSNLYDVTILKSMALFAEKLNHLKDLTNRNNRNNNDTPDLIVADLMLKDGNFLDYLMNSPQTILDVPFIVVSAVDDIDSLRICFAEGAIDYLSKPFRKNELLVKIENALLKKDKMGVEASKETFKLIEIDGKKITGLTIKQGQIMKLFLNSPNREISRQDILAKIWKGLAVHPKTVDVHLYNLRRKLGHQGHIIRSVGEGKWELIPSTYESFRES